MVTKSMQIKRFLLSIALLVVVFVGLKMIQPHDAKAHKPQEPEQIAPALVDSICECGCDSCTCCKCTR